MTSSGILLLDKPEGVSSNGALQRVKRLLGARKAGHVGSLDPLATGMLPICLGEATKIAGDLTGRHKRYAFELALGARTETGDREGAVIETAPVPPLGDMDIEAALARFRGRIAQIPPMYSALKRDGQPLYRLARAGREVERTAREIEIRELTLTARRGDVLAFEALCSKGTYIRVLGEDIARSLGTCGHVIRLRRLFVSPFEREPMLALEELESMCRAGRRPALIPPDLALPDLPSLVVSADGARRLSYGQSIAMAEAQPMCIAAGQSLDPRGDETIARRVGQAGDPLARVRLYAPNGAFLGLGEADGNTVKPKRMFLVGEGSSE